MCLCFVFCRIFPCFAKGGLLRCERLSFALPFAAFCRVKGRLLQSGLPAAVLRLPVCAPALQQVGRAKSLRHALPRVVGHGHCQGEGQAEGAPYGLQVAVDVVQGAAVLLPLLARVAGRDDGEEVGSAGLRVAVGNVLQHPSVGHAHFAARGLGRVCQPVAVYVAARQAEDVAPGHAVRQHGEEEHVACEAYCGPRLAELQARYAAYVVKRQPLPVLLRAVARVNSGEGIAALRQSVGHGVQVDPLQVAQVEGDRVAAESLAREPRPVVADEPRGEGGEGNVALPDEGGEPADVRVELVRRVIPPLLLHGRCAPPRVGDEARPLHSVRYGCTHKHPAHFLTLDFLILNS